MAGIVALDNNIIECDERDVRYDLQKPDWKWLSESI